MSKTVRFTSILLLLALIILQNAAVKPVHKWEMTFGKKYAVTSTVKSNADASRYLIKYGYNPCENKTKLKKNNKTSIDCHIDLKSMMKDFQRKFELKVTGKLDKKTLKLMNTPRCRIKDHPLTFTAAKAW